MEGSDKRIAMGALDMGASSRTVGVWLKSDWNHQQRVLIHRQVCLKPSSSPEAGLKPDPHIYP